MALRHGYAVKYIMGTYDIACQYENKIEERFAKNFPDLVDVVSQIEFLVPKLHLHGHKDDCQYCYSLNFTDNAGRTHGEGIETGWAVRNEEGGSTKETNHGHRSTIPRDDHSEIGTGRRHSRCVSFCSALVIYFLRWMSPSQNTIYRPHKSTDNCITKCEHFDSSPSCYLQNILLNGKSWTTSQSLSMASG